MPYQTMKENLKLQLSPGLVTAYDIKPGNGVGLFWDTKHTHIYLLTYFHRTHTGKISQQTSIQTYTTKPWFSHLLRHQAWKWSGSILGHKTHTYLLTYLLSPDTHWKNQQENQHTNLNRLLPNMARLPP